MRERVTVVTLSVCQSVSQSVCHFLILEKAPFSGLKLTSVHSRRRFKSFKCSTSKLFGEKASGTSAVTFSDLLGQRPVIKRFARDLLACGTLYQSCQLRCSSALVSSLRVGLQACGLLSFPANSKLVCY